MTRHEKRPPEKGEGLRCATSKQAPKVYIKTSSPNFERSSPEAQSLCTQALRTIAGEVKAREFIQALRDGVKQSDDLMRTMGALHDGEMPGFCRAIAKALEVRNAA
jgi:hypothetical protein